MRISYLSSDVCSSDLDARRVRRQLGAGFAQRLRHFAEDVRAAFLRLVQSGFEDVARDARDLDVHLHRGDALGRASHLEVHRSEEHTSEPQSLMRISYAVFCLKKKKHKTDTSNKQ